MTLFKKVFQTQSQPASKEDVLDEDALRRAFAEAEEAADPLDLDPFECVEAKAADEPGVEEDLEEGELIQPDASTEQDLETDAFQMIDGDVVQDEDLTDEWYENDPPQELEEAVELAEEAVVEEDEPAQSDEEIAACLDRALAADAPETQAESDTFDLSHGVEAASDEPIDEPIDDLVTSELVDEETSDDVDLTQFAQQQMAVLETEEANANDGLDLSAAGSDGLDTVPAPAAGRAGRRAGRVKTRLLGFNRTGDAEHDPFGQAPEATASAQREKYPVGWLVIVEGPGVGHSFSIFTGASMIGRGEDQVIRLDFGDNSISRNNHAAIAYDEEQNKFYIGHGGKSNIIRRNARPVLSTEELHHADLIRIGETTLRFVALCGSDFQWNISGVTNADGV